MNILASLFLLAVVLVLRHLYCWRPLAHHPFYPVRPFFMGHRGVPTRAPENTLRSYREAVQAGFQGTELDVMETRDGEIVCSHNFDLERMTDGTGYLFEYSLDELAGLNAAHRFSPAEPESIPLLRTVLETLPSGYRLNIEIKSRSLADISTAWKVARLVRQRHLQERVLISSFNPLVLLLVKWVDRNILTGFLVEALTWPLFRLINVAHPDCLHPDVNILTMDMLRYARERGLTVNVWTVNNRPAIEWLVQQGVDGIITDRPEYCDL